MSAAVDGERSVSEVAGRKKPLLSPGKKAGLIAGASGIAILLIFLVNPGHKKKQEAPQAPPNGIGQNVAYDPPKPAPMPPPLVQPPLPQTAPPQPPAAPPAQALPPPQPLFQHFQTPTHAGESKPTAQRMLTFEVAPHSDAPGSKPGGAGEAREGGTQVVYKGAQIVGAEAGPALDRSLVLMPGIIRCVLDTAIDSTLPGPLLCHMPSPVISDGGVVLMDKGTQVIGQYTSDVKQGQGRLMAVTATAYTPNGIPVPLGGPFADDLGRSGLEGNVDTHLFQRFGGAVLLSLADSAFSLAQASVSKGGNSYVSLNSGGGVGSLAQEVLRNTINMPPTITKNAGDTISLWILAPIDFSKAYHLKEAR